MVNINNRNLYKIESLSFVVLCIVSIFSYSNKMTDSNIVPKWCFSTIAFLLFFVLLSVKKICNGHIRIDTSVFCCIIFFICAIQALYGILQWLNLLPSHNQYRITGSFDNPAGFSSCLCVGLPFVEICIKATSGNGWKVFLYLLVSIIDLSVILSGSRTGIVCIITITFIWLNKYVIMRKREKMTLFICVFIILFISYFVKKKSADGRLLIWNCSCEMVKNSPWSGYGINGFRANYMYFQAKYFKKYPNSKYAMLADNVLCPFNEYLRLIVSFGFMGLLVFLILILLLAYSLHRGFSEDKLVCFLSLICIGIFSTFSYPLTYPFVWAILLFDIYIIIHDVIYFRIAPIYYKLAYSIMMVICLFFLYKAYNRVNAEYRWKSITEKQNSSEMLTAYSDLMVSFKDNPYFLYNYAVVLFNAKHFNECLEKALLCQKYWADYDMEMLIGYLYMQKKEFNQSEMYFINASYMCPCRFMPLYNLFELYLETGEKHKARIFAHKILDQKVKNNTFTIMQIKYKAYCCLYRNDVITNLQ